MNNQSDNTSKDQPVDELRKSIYGCAFAVETHPDDFVLRINQKGVDELLELCQAECNRARLSEARYVENYFDGEAFYPDEWQRRIAELQQLIKKGE